MFGGVTCFETLPAFAVIAAAAAVLPALFAVHAPKPLARQLPDLGSSVCT